MAKQVLGRGLDSLLDTKVATSGSSSINEIEIDKIQPNPKQPRSFFDEETLDELAASIREYGIIQPVTLRKLGDDNYQIISGERRYKAAKKANLRKIPAYIRTAEDEQVMAMALIENIQREDLNSIEIALSYSKLLEEMTLTQEQLSEKIGKNRATIANYLRLLKLPAEIQMGITAKKIDMGHARALLTLEDAAKQLDLYHQTLEDGYSVRKVEELARIMSGKEEASTDTATEQEKTEKKSQALAPQYESLKSEVADALNTKVQLSANNGKGKITIAFSSDEELQTIIEKLKN